MSASQYACPRCGSPLGYETTKHNGCPGCGFVPAHGSE